MDELVRILINALISGGMLAVGMVVGAKLTSRSMVKEVDKWMQQSELFQALKKTVTDQTLIDEATKFFKEARAWISSPEAKNLFVNITELLKELSGEPKVKFELPTKTTKSKLSKTRDGKQK